MERIFYLLKQSLFVKLALVTALLFFGGRLTVLADTVIVDGSTISTGWSTGSIASTNNKIDIPGESILISSTGAFTNKTTYLEGYKYTWCALYSNQKISISSGQKFIIGAQGMGSTSAKLCLKYSSTSQSDNSSFTAAATFTTEIRSSALQDDFTELIIENIPEGEYYIQIISKAVNINSVVLTDLETPQMKVSPSTLIFGSMFANGSQTITVTNKGVGSMDVTIVNDNTTDFTLSATSLAGIGASESKTFDVTFNYDANNLGGKSATIIVTPSYNANDAIIISVTANAVSDDDPQLSVTPDENSLFGNVTGNRTKTYTVTNVGTGSMNVNITSTNSEYFTVSPASITDLESGDSEDFTVTYNYILDVDKLGNHEADIIVTPSYNPASAVIISASAISVTEAVFDEYSTPSYTSGNKSLLVKYTPNDGWNTICLPISISKNNYSTIAVH